MHYGPLVEISVFACSNIVQIYLSIVAAHETEKVMHAKETEKNWFVMSLRGI